MAYEGTETYSNSTTSNSITVAFTFTNGVTLAISHFGSDTIAFAESITRTDSDGEPFPDSIGLIVRESEREGSDTERATLQVRRN